MSIVERIRQAARALAPSPGDAVVKLAGVRSPGFDTTATDVVARWRRLAEYLRLDPSHVERVCSAYSDWCEWLLMLFEGEQVPVPPAPPPLDVMALIERASQIAPHITSVISLRELVKEVVSALEKRAEEVPRRAEEAVKLIRGLYQGAREAVAEELKKALSLLLQPAFTKPEELRARLEEASSLMARAIFEAQTPREAIEKLRSIVQATREQAKSPEAVGRRATEVPRHEVPVLRPRAEVKRLAR